MESSAKPVRL